MSTRSEDLILSAAISGFGYHPGAAQDHPRRLIEVDHYRQLVQTAERGLLDFVLLEDGRALPDQTSFGRLDARRAPRLAGTSGDGVPSPPQPFGGALVSLGGESRSAGMSVVDHHDRQAGVG